jgi:hypothetical protein
MIVLASITADRWRLRSFPKFAAGVLLAALAVWIAVPALPRSFNGQVDFGVTPWQPSSRGRSAIAATDAGFTVYPHDGMLRISIRTASPGEPVESTLTIAGIGERRITVPGDLRTVEFVEQFPEGERWTFVQSRATRPIEIETP